MAKVPNFSSIEEEVINCIKYDKLSHSELLDTVKSVISYNKNFYT